MYKRQVLKGVIGKQWEITGTGVLRAEYFLTAIQQRQRILPGFTTISEGDVLDFLVAKNKEKHSDTQDQLQFFLLIYRCAMQ